MNFEVLVINFKMGKPRGVDYITMHSAIQPWPYTRNLGWQPTVTLWMDTHSEENNGPIPFQENEGGNVDDLGIHHQNHLIREYLEVFPKTGFVEVHEVNYG